MRLKLKLIVGSRSAVQYIIPTSFAWAPKWVINLSHIPFFFLWMLLLPFCKKFISRMVISTWKQTPHPASSSAVLYHLSFTATLDLTRGMICYNGTRSYNERMNFSFASPGLQSFMNCGLISCDDYKVKAISLPHVDTVVMPFMEHTEISCCF